MLINKNVAQVLKNQSINHIVDNINHYIKTKNITKIEIKVISKLKSDNSIIYIINDNKTKRLLENDC